ncbi:MAG: hypothetical protein VX299_02865 [Pseudomonadota bacterium]|nr:hypothetical protein [Pseudomonadota bacterium]
MPLLQALGPQAITGGGKIQHLHLGLAPIDEDEILARPQDALHMSQLRHWLQQDFGPSAPSPRTTP